LALYPRFERGFQLERSIEVVFDGVFRGVRYQNDFGNTGSGAFVNHVLNQWFVRQGEHFLGDGFTGRQHPGAKAGDRDDCFGDFRHGLLDWLYQTHLRRGLDHKTSSG